MNILQWKLSAVKKVNLQRIQHNFTYRKTTFICVIHDKLYKNLWISGAVEKIVNVDCLLRVSAAYPHVRSFDRSQSVVAGRSLVLDCRAWGWRTPNVSWYRGQFELTPFTDSRVSLSAAPGRPPSSRLTIDDVQPSDRAHYTCVAWSDAFGGILRQNNATVLVRVKGQQYTLLILGWLQFLATAKCIITAICRFMFETTSLRPESFYWNRTGLNFNRFVRIRHHFFINRNTRMATTTILISPKSHILYFGLFCWSDFF